MISFITVIKYLTANIIFIGIFIFLAMAIYHHIMLFFEKRNIKPRGTIVKVDGYNMNLYLEGAEGSYSKPTIVLLSGSGIAAPIYDYKPLYSRVTDEFKVVILEKFGYGYSEVSGLPRDVKTMVEENRKALQEIGEYGPYFLMPHSMSALESIYWANTYPDEVKAIIGLDMAVPESYDENNSNIKIIKFNKIMTFFGFHRIPLFYYIKEDGLTSEEIKQNKYLAYRNSLNKDVYEECKMVYENAKTVKEIGTPDIPILMFTSNLGGAKGGEIWVRSQEVFASKSDKCTQIKLECGHNMHYYESESISKRIKEFIKKT